MAEMKKDILILFVSGILSFMSGLFIISTVIFAATSMFPNMNGNAQLQC